MSKGIVIFAEPTAEFDYLRIAELSAASAWYHLGLPVTLVTTVDVEPTGFERVIVIDPSADNQRIIPHTQNRRHSSWFNLSRLRAYELSPYDRTLLIDCDFIVNGNTLLLHMNGSFDFALCKTAYDPISGNTYHHTVGTTLIPQYWATAMIFNKSRMAADMFAAAQFVLDNYSYYSALYYFDTYPIRLDYVFSIACHLMGGWGNTDYSLKNYNLCNLDYRTTLDKLDNRCVFSRDEHISFSIGMDLHVMNKSSLLEHCDV